MSDTRKRILDAARELYLERGHRGVTMRGVADRVGVTATALYRHFNDKESLVEEVVSEGFRMFSGYLYRSLEGADAAERFRLSGEAYLSFGLEQPEFYRTLFMSARFDGSSQMKNEDPRSSATFRFLVDRVAECVNDGVLRTDDLEPLALTIWAHTHGLLSLFIAGALPVDEEEFREVYGKSLNHLMEGIAT